MKIYKINSLTTIFFAFLLFGLVVFLPIVFIEALWNSTVGKSFTDITINFWQAFILWLMVLVTLNIIGIFKFEFAVESFDKELIKQKIQDIQDMRNKIEPNKPEAENKVNKGNEEKKN